MSSMTFRNSKIVYYGPHKCGNCGDFIAKMGAEFGGTAFTYPRGPIYPNTEWHPHVCDPAKSHREMSEPKATGSGPIPPYAPRLDGRLAPPREDEHAHNCS